MYLQKNKAAEYNDFGNTFDFEDKVYYCAEDLCDSDALTAIKLTQVMKIIKRIYLLLKLLFKRLVTVIFYRCLYWCESFKYAVLLRFIRNDEAGTDLFKEGSICERGLLKSIVVLLETKQIVFMWIMTLMLIL